MDATLATGREPEPDLATMKRADLPSIFRPFSAELERLRATAKTLTVTDVADKVGMKLARETRLALVSLAPSNVKSTKAKEAIEGTFVIIGSLSENLRECAEDFNHKN